MRSTSRAGDCALIAVIGLALLAPTIDWTLRGDDVRSVHRENREPAPQPELFTDMKTLSAYPAAVERWYGDTLGARDLLLRGSQVLDALVLGLDPSPTIIPGADGFAFFAGDDSERVHRGLRPATTAELASWTRTLVAQRDRCRRLGAEFVFVIAPDKQSVYPEKWPADRPVVGPKRLDQFMEYLRTASDVRCLDLRPALAREREFDRPEAGDFVYHPLGSHFTWRGGFAAWNAVLAGLTGVLDGVHTLARSEFASRELGEHENDSMYDQTYIGDLVHQRGYAFEARNQPAPAVEYGPQNEILASTLDDANLPSALIVHDSFGPWMLPFATRSFARMHAVWAQRIPRELIERYRPDVVIQICTERRLVWEFAELVADLEHVSAAEFDAFRPSFGPLDPARDALFATRGGVQITRQAATWVIDQRSGDGLVALPAADLSEGSDLGLHLVITAPAETSMVVFFQTRTAPAFARARSLSINLNAGRNDLRLRTRVQGLYGPLQLRLSAQGEYTLHAFEMRAAQ